MDALITRYLTRARRERRLSEHTLEVYGSDLHLLARFLAEHRPGVTGATFGPEDVGAWLDAQAHCTAGTVRRRLTTLRACLAQGVRDGRLTRNVLEEVALPRVPERLPDVFSRAEVGQVFQSLAAADDWLAPRDRALVELLYGTGLRRAEVRRLDVTDLDLDGGSARVRGKGGREDLQPLTPPVVAAIRTYLPLRASLRAVRRHREPGEALFLTYCGQRISRETVGELVKHRVTAAGLTVRANPHKWRHTFLTHLHQEGADIRLVQVLARHKSIQTTQRYVHVDDREKRETLARFHPRHGA